MSPPDDSSLTFREQAIIEATARRVVEMWAEKYPNLAQHLDESISWKDFFYSLAKGSAGMILAFILLACLWAVIQYLKAGAPAVPGVTH